MSEVSGSEIAVHSERSKPARVDDVVAAAVEDVLEVVVETAWVVCGLVWVASVDGSVVDAAVLSPGFSLAHPHNRKIAIKDKTNHFTLNKWSDAI